MPASVRSVSVAATTGSSITAARPAGTAAGDHLLALHFNDIDPDTTGPSEWASVGEGSAATHVRVWHKIADSDEPATYTFGTAASTDSTLHIIAVQGASATIDPHVAVVDTTGTATTTPDVAPAAASHLEIRAASITPYPDTASWVIPAGYAARGLLQSNLDFVSSVVVTKQISSSAPSGAKDFVASPVVSRWGIGVTVSVASGVVTVPDTGPAPPPFTPGLGSALYRYVFRRWDGTYLDDLDLVNVSFDKRILQPGSLSATIPIPNSRVASRVSRVVGRSAEDLRAGPGVVLCEIYRGGTPWGEYWITGARIGRSGNSVPTIQLRGSSLEAYLLHVELQEALGPYVGEDQIDIARALLTHMQAQPYANLDLVLQPGTSGTTRDRTYAADEATYGQRLTELAQVDDGFEWVINHTLGASGLERHWVWGAPLGQQDPPLHTFVDALRGGDVLEWNEEIDALRGATRWRARGDRVSSDVSTSSGPLISAAAEAAAHLAAGWPRLDKTVNHNSVTEMTTLDTYAAYWAATAPGALRVDSITVALGAKPSFSPNSLGDTARIHLANQWHLPHWRTRRIIGVGITPTSRADGKEVAQLILEGQEAPTS